MRSNTRREKILLTLYIFRRKRFKRYFEKDEEPLQVKGNQIGTADAPASTSKTPKKAGNTNGEKAASTPKTPKSAVKKRKADELKSDDNVEAGEESEVEKPDTEPVTPVAASDNELDDNDNGEVKKSSKAATKKKPAPIKTPKTPKGAKSADEPKTPKSAKRSKAKTPRTPKSASKAIAKNTTKAESDTEVEVKEDEANGGGVQAEGADVLVNEEEEKIIKKPKTDNDPQLKDETVESLTGVEVKNGEPSADIQA